MATEVEASWTAHSSPGEPHTVTASELHLTVLSGELDVRMGTKSYVATKGETIVLPTKLLMT